VIGHDASNSALSFESNRDLVSNSPNSIGCGIDVRPPGLKSKQITKRLESKLKGCAISAAYLRVELS
jgi:hypothetical protein